MPHSNIEKDMRIIYNIFCLQRKELNSCLKNILLQKNDKKQYKHLTKDDRIKIEILINTLDENGNRLFSNSYIARVLNVNRSTITRD